MVGSADAKKKEKKPSSLDSFTHGLLMTWATINHRRKAARWTVKSILKQLAVHPFGEFQFSPLNSPCSLVAFLPELTGYATSDPKTAYKPTNVRKHSGQKRIPRDFSVAFKCQQSISSSPIPFVLEATQFFGRNARFLEWLAVLPWEMCSAKKPSKSERGKNICECHNQPFSVLFSPTWRTGELC